MSGTVDEFWDDCPLTIRVEGMVSGAPVVRNERGEATRLPVDALDGNVESFMEISGFSENQAIKATLDCFPETPGGADTIRKLLAYQEAHLAQPQL